MKEDVEKVIKITFTLWYRTVIAKLILYSLYSGFNAGDIEQHFFCRHIVF